MATSTPSQYALGRNSIFRLQLVNINESLGVGAIGGGIVSGVVTPGQIVNICVMSGSIDLSANTISIINNCNYGWEVKLPGTKTGTISLTGHVSSFGAGTAFSLDAVMAIGTLVNFDCEAFDSNNTRALNFAGQAAVTGVRTSIDINDAVTCELTLEISGAPQLTGSNASYINLASST